MLGRNFTFWSIFYRIVLYSQFDLGKSNLLCVWISWFGFRHLDSHNIPGSNYCLLYRSLLRKLPLVCNLILTVGGGGASLLEPHAERMFLHTVSSII